VIAIKVLTIVVRPLAMLFSQLLLACTGSQFTIFAVEIQVTREKHLCRNIGT